MWSWLFALFALACAWVAWRTPRMRIEAVHAASGPIPASQIALWLALSATGSVLLLAVTNHITQNVAAVPLMWLAPLTLYLLTFIIAFEGSSWYRPRILWPFVLVWLAGMAWVLVDDAYHHDLAMQLGMFLPGLFLGCLFCHGELYRTRPAAEHLTKFYLIVSAGGALGGLFVAVAAPLAFDAYYELGIGLAVLALLAALRFTQLGRLPGFLALAVLMGVTAAAAYEGLKYHEDALVTERGFYGVLRVKEYGTPGEPSHLRRLVHGTIMHGEQYLHEERRRFITTYYQETSGIGLAIRSKQERGPVRVGVIGLGTGTLAAYGRPGDVYRFYDIDPRVVDIAQEQFTYLSDSAADIEVALGDARLTLEREPPQEFDVLAVDAFSSDAIPVHLITREALAVYLRHVRPDGVVAFHVSNRFLDLIPVVARLARENAAHAVLVTDDPDDEDDSLRSRTDWVLVSRDPQALRRQPIVAGGARDVPERPRLRTWTDDYSNLIQILK
jgi:spermidine synthase